MSLNLQVTDKSKPSSPSATAKLDSTPVSEIRHSTVFDSDLSDSGPTRAYRTFELFLDDDRYAVPTLHLISALDAEAALQTAARLMAESEHHLGAELCLDGERLGGLGTFATRRLPSEPRGSAAKD